MVINECAAANGACGTAAFCLVGVGVCNDISGWYWGTCYGVPETCTVEYAPVCGCNGYTVTPPVAR